MKRLHILCLALLAAATLGGCHRYLAREVRIVPKDVETYGSAGADVTLHVANRGGRPLRFEAAALSLAYDGGEVLRATLRDTDRKSTRLNSSHMSESRMPSSA